MLLSAVITVCSLCCNVVYCFLIVIIICALFLYELFLITTSVYGSPAEFVNPRAILTGHDCEVTCASVCAELGLVISGCRGKANTNTHSLILIRYSAAYRINWVIFYYYFLIVTKFYILLVLNS